MENHAILIIDGDSAFLLVFKEYMNSYAVKSAENLEEGMNLSRLNDFDLVMIDDKTLKGERKCLSKIKELNPGAKMILMLSGGLSKPVKENFTELSATVSKSDCSCDFLNSIVKKFLNKGG